MQKVSIANGSTYLQELQKFKDSKLHSRLSDKFRIKPYHEQNKKLRLLALFSSYLFNLSSITISLYFAYMLLNSFLGLVGGLIASIAILGVLEGFKRLILGNLFAYYLQFDKIKYLATLVGLGLVLLSGFFSYQGGAAANVIFAPGAKSINTDSIKANYQKLIAPKTAQQVELLQTKYKGTTTRTAQKAINAIQAEINTLRSQESKFLSIAAGKNKQALNSHKNKVYLKGFYFSLLALIFDLSLIFCLFYIEYYDYHSFVEFSTLDDGSTATVSPLGGGANELNRNDSTNDSKTVQTIPVKHCLNCQAVFDVSNPKKKFCSTSCRVKHWEIANQKKLNVPIA